MYLLWSTYAQNETSDSRRRDSQNYHNPLVRDIRPTSKKDRKNVAGNCTWIQPIFVIVLIQLGAIFMMRIAGINLW